MKDILNIVFLLYNIGYPLGSSTFNVTNGIISGFEGISDEVAIQHTAPISHGSSGGALLNIDGEVIGVTSSGVPDGENIGFAIPVQSVINLWVSSIVPPYHIYFTNIFFVLCDAMA